jgi:hypothetical protein
MMISSAPKVRSASWIAVADLAAGLDATLAEPREARVQPLLRLLARAVDVGGERSHRAVQRGGNHEHLGRVAGAVLLDPLPQRLAADGLVGDHEDPTLVRVAVANRCRLPRGLDAPSPHPPEDDPGREHDEHGESCPAVQDAGDRDQPEVDRGAQEEPECLGL